MHKGGDQSLIHVSTQRIWRTLKSAIEAFLADDVMTAAAALAFYSALGLAPLILLFTTISGMLGYEAQDTLVREFDRLTGEQGGKAIAMIISSADRNEEAGIVATIISLIVLGFSASGVFAQLQVMLNQVFDAKPPPSTGVISWLRRRLFSIGMVFSMGFLMLVSLIASAGLTVLLNGEGALIIPLQYLVSIILFSIVFLAIFKFLPDDTPPLQHLVIGSVLTSLLFSAGHTGISFYLGHSAVGSAYGAAGSLIVTLVWVYYSSIIVFFGAEVTQSLRFLETKRKPKG